MPSIGVRKTFGSEERLKSRKLIESLMSRGAAIQASPIRLVWLETDTPGRFPASTTVAVSKRSFKKAADRNKLKRRMREAFRQQKEALYERLKEKNKRVCIMLVYASKETSSYAHIEAAMHKALEKLRTTL